MQEMVKTILIDEVGEYRLRNKKESDHNTILIDLEYSSPNATGATQTTKWNIKAPPEAWALFREELTRNTNKAKQIMSDSNSSMTDRYKRWDNLLYKTAIKTIGK